MIPIADISAGDKVSFFCERLRSTKTRTVKTIKDGCIEVRHGQVIYSLKPEQIKSVLKMGRYKTGRSAIDIEMRRRGVTNIGLAEVSGYSVRAVGDARVGKRVKAVTLADITQALGAM